MKTHHCQICRTDFASAFSLRRHSLCKHGSKKLIHCNLCGSRFSRDDDLLRHKNTKHGKRISCPHCGLNFTRKDNMKVHIRRQHLMDTALRDGQNDVTEVQRHRQNNVTGVQRQNVLGTHKLSKSLFTQERNTMPCTVPKFSCLPKVRKGPIEIDVISRQSCGLGIASWEKDKTKVKVNNVKNSTVKYQFAESRCSDSAYDVPDGAERGQTDFTNTDSGDTSFPYYSNDHHLIDQSWDAVYIPLLNLPQDRESQLRFNREEQNSKSSICAGCGYYKSRRLGDYDYCSVWCDCECLCCRCPQNSTTLSANQLIRMISPEFESSAKADCTISEISEYEISTDSRNSADTTTDSTDGYQSSVVLPTTVSSNIVLRNESNTTAECKIPSRDSVENGELRAESPKGYLRSAIDTLTCEDW